jgi:hypothetical protein
MPNVDVPGVGVIAFPDGMKPEDMAAVIKRQFGAQIRAYKQSHLTPARPTTYTLTVDGVPYTVNWSKPQPPTDADFTGIAHQLRQNPAHIAQAYAPLIGAGQQLASPQGQSSLLSAIAAANDTTTLERVAEVSFLAVVLGAVVVHSMRRLALMWRQMTVRRVIAFALLVACGLMLFPPFIDYNARGGPASGYGFVLAPHFGQIDVVRLLVELAILAVGTSAVILLMTDRRRLV